MPKGSKLSIDFDAISDIASFSIEDGAGQKANPLSDLDPFKQKSVAMESRNPFKDSKKRDSDDEFDEEDEQDTKLDEEDDEDAEAEDEDDEDETHEEDDEEDEGAGEDDEDEPESYSAKDLKRLTAFPSEIRGDIAKLPKKAQARLVSWLDEQNEDKRRITADSTHRNESAVEEYKKAIDIRTEMANTLKAMKENFEKNKGSLTDDTKKVVSEFMKHAADAVLATSQETYKRNMEYLQTDARPEVEAFLRSCGYKPDAWMEKHPDEADLLFYTAMFTPRDKRRSRLQKLSHLVERAGKASAPKKTRPRPAKKATSSRSKFGKVVNALAELSGFSPDS